MLPLFEDGRARGYGGGARESAGGGWASSADRDAVVSRDSREASGGDADGVAADGADRWADCFGACVVGEGRAEPGDFVYRSSGILRPAGAVWRSGAGLSGQCGAIYFSFESGGVSLAEFAGAAGVGACARLASGIGAGVDPE